jgi:hypothetical protein
VRLLTYPSRSRSVLRGVGLTFCSSIESKFGNHQSLDTCWYPSLTMASAASSFLWHVTRHERHESYDTTMFVGDTPVLSYSTRPFQLFITHRNPVPSERRCSAQRPRSNHDSPLDFTGSTCVQKPLTSTRNKKSTSLHLRAQRPSFEPSRTVAC